MKTTTESTGVLEQRIRAALPADADYLFRLDVLAQQAQAAAAGRGDAAAKRNQAKGEAVHAGVRLALGKMISLGAKPEKLTVPAVQSFILRNGPTAFGLKRTPGEKIIRAEMKKLK